MYLGRERATGLQNRWYLQQRPLEHCSAARVLRRPVPGVSSVDAHCVCELSRHVADVPLLGDDAVLMHPVQQRRGPGAALHSLQWPAFRYAGLGLQRRARDCSPLPGRCGKSWGRV